MGGRTGTGRAGRRDTSEASTIVHGVEVPGFFGHFSSTVEASEGWERAGITTGLLHKVALE